MSIESEEVFYYFLGSLFVLILFFGKEKRIFFFGLNLVFEGVVVWLDFLERELLGR